MKRISTILLVVFIAACSSTNPRPLRTDSQNKLRRGILICTVVCTALVCHFINEDYR